ncbi:ABC transporter substrate-binding protein [Paenibacillus hamazuiensis]|uniref:ABC transporter substrate-binding protein n=1 Tax=Paenibacillus hamazuiensis TaxID=2936508 RepID=UPI00200CAF5F|nr:sugar ABC transporter substrate-binding protein [Paenibacillus hamazuiensis]
MFRKGLTIGMSALLAAALSACGGDSASKAGEKEAKGGQEKVALRFSWWGGEARHKLFTQMIEDFEKKHPNIKIEQEFSDFDPYFDKLATQVAGGDPPDIMSMHLTRYMDYANRNQLLPLDEIVQSKAVDVSDWNPKILDLGKANGKLVMLSIGNSSKGFFYNADLFKRANVEPPKFDITWDEFAAKAAELKKAVGKPDFYFIDDQSGIMDTFGYFNRQRGKDNYTKDGKLGFTKEDMIAYHQYWDKLRKDGLIPPAPLSAEYKGKQHQESMLAKGITAAVFAPGNQMKIYQSFMKDELDVVREPGDPNGKSGEDIGGVFLSISAKSKHPKEAAEFIKYFLNDEDGVKMYKDEQGVVASPKSDALIDPLRVPADKKIAAYQKKITPYINVPNTAPAGGNDINKQFGNASEAIAFGKKTIEQAVNDFFNEAGKILK